MWYILQQVILQGVSVKIRIIVWWYIVKAMFHQYIKNPQVH